MRCASASPAWVVLSLSIAVASAAEQLPWKVNPPIVSVKKELYKKHPRPRAAALVSVVYVGPGLQRREWQALEIQDDVADEQRARWSMDNGRTWSDWAAQAPSSVVKYQGVSVWEGGGATVYDPDAKVLVEMWLRQIAVGGVYNCFTYWRISRDFGRTWSEPKQLRYEPGEPFDPKEPLKPGFLKHNQGYPGNNILLHSNGTLLHCLAHANAPGDAQNVKRPWKMGSVTVIDDRRPEQGPAVQFSNFSLLENRETHELELHLTTYGQEKDRRRKITSYC